MDAMFELDEKDNIKGLLKAARQVFLLGTKVGDTAQPSGNRAFEGGGFSQLQAHLAHRYRPC
jgi:hypothetical protein